jgi:hypothetical protein
MIEVQLAERLLIDQTANVCVQRFQVVENANVCVDCVHHGCVSRVQAVGRCIMSERWNRWIQTCAQN